MLKKIVFFPSIPSLPIETRQTCQWTGEAKGKERNLWASFPPQLLIQLPLQEPDTPALEGKP